jgi:pimeloyl-ACP methyl ester carboxylesterase
LADDHLAPLLVLLPGLDGTGILFRQFVEALGSSVETRIVTYPVDRALGYAELEALVRAALPTDRPYVVLGESFSGPIAMRLGGGRPAEDPPVAGSPAGLLGVILCVTFAKNPYPSLGRAGLWAANFSVNSLPGWVRALFMWGTWATERARQESALATAAVDVAVVRHRIAALLTVDATNALARIRIPTLVLQATGDHVLPRSATEHILRTLPTAALAEIGGPHLLLQSRPAECAAAIRQFMQTLQLRGSPAEVRTASCLSVNGDLDRRGRAASSPSP